jgi:hypothetical protein
MENTLTRSVKVFVFLIFISGFLVTQSVVAQNEPQIKNGENTLSINLTDAKKCQEIYSSGGFLKGI